MRLRYMIWTGHFLGFVLVLFGLWWIIGHISGMPDYKLVVALAAMTGFVFNHIRWSGLGRKVNDPDASEKINFLIVSHYVVLLLVFSLADFYR